MIDKIWADLSINDFIKRWYSEIYSEMTYSVLAKKIQRFMHGSLERKMNSTTHFESVLELGGNKGEHIPFVKHGYFKYILTDIENRLSPFEISSLEKLRIEFKVMDAESLSINNESIDRIIVTCMLHHLIAPENALLEMRRVVKTGGQIDIFLSGDPGMLFRIARRLGPGSWAKKRGLDEVKSLLDARDHRNHVGALERQVRHIFRNDEVIERSYPINRLGWNLILWKTFRITKKASNLE